MSKNSRCKGTATIAYLYEAEAHIPYQRDELPPCMIVGPMAKEHQNSANATSNTRREYGSWGILLRQGC